MSKQTSGRDARVGILPDTPRQRDVSMFTGFLKSPLWANLYRQELAKESGKPIIQMLLDENYREPPDAKLKPIVVPGQVCVAHACWRRGLGHCLDVAAVDVYHLRDNHDCFTVCMQEYDEKHGVTIVKSIVEGVNYRYDDGSNSKDLIKKLKLLPRSVKEAAVHPPPLATQPLSNIDQGSHAGAHESLRQRLHPPKHIQGHSRSPCRSRLIAHLLSRSTFSPPPHHTHARQPFEALHHLPSFAIATRPVHISHPIPPPS
jgi:hypothetical protein